MFLSAVPPGGSVVPPTEEACWSLMVLVVLMGRRGDFSGQLIIRSVGISQRISGGSATVRSGKSFTFHHSDEDGLLRLDHCPVT